MGQAGGSGRSEFAQGRVDRLAKAAESVVPEWASAPDGGELRHDGVGGGLAALLLLTLHLRRLGEALDLIGPPGGGPDAA